MAQLLSVDVVIKRLGQISPVATAASHLTLAPKDIVAAATLMRDDPELDLVFLNSLTAVDINGQVEVVYHAQSLKHNHMLRFKAIAQDYETPEMPSVADVWWGAQLMEREAFDLMGVRFAGHPDLRRILLWEGFPGHPLRKDYLRVPNANPGWPYFPGEPETETEPAWRQDWLPAQSGAPATRGEDPADVAKHDDLLRTITDDRERTRFGDPD
ncbi:MAG TPA: NADH-quinone oxidoreductase subunit C [Dehalococcoidia bacterium]|nr:NADH-quinone oxidoreductase subunit C [Dehalococcoidia bacterium]